MVLAADHAVRQLVSSVELGVVDVVPAARTLLVTTQSPEQVAPLTSRLEEVLSGVAGGEPGPAEGEVDVPVVYDGPDLAEVAAATGLTEAEVVAAHTGTPWRVAFGGFAPGFAYLVGGDDRLEVPRRATPRTSVPAGSVGLAGEFSGIYPRSSPGGWQLVGHTDLVLFDVDRDPPALLRPGWTVRFRAVG
ncbi:5-oxoprolinase subunit PxpB [Knoellia sp. DB2414S]|uniref:5-oxoprolinase subunit PxpB n=2 Tax=Knoellia koreensis TaxID=2730921 RepID=A0A849HL31_9MICO|nr:5-oxoprolinase subunit PxpB [Knoellia sp. DB2414S]NNM48128.1 5-oxoprolinase subunit PxpB [Knoellia sp. DB2414S]